MSSYEILSLLTAAVAAAIAFVALYRTHRVARRQIELQEIQAAFAKFQHEQLAKEYAAKHRADVWARLVREDRSEKIVFFNQGQADALDVTFSTDVPEEQSPFMASEVQSLFPVKKLRPGEEVKMLIVTLSTTLPCPVVVHWKDPSGASQSNEFKLNL